MTESWKIDPCYAQNGVDGTPCSFQIYLSEVERWCPSLEAPKKKRGKEVTNPGRDGGVEGGGGGRGDRW